MRVIIQVHMHTTVCGECKHRHNTVFHIDLKSLTKTVLIYSEIEFQIKVPEN